jgi:hypothetical protein
MAVQRTVLAIFIVGEYRGQVSGQRNGRARTLLLGCLFGDVEDVLRGKDDAEHAECV